MSNFLTNMLADSDSIKQDDSGLQFGGLLYIEIGKLKHLHSTSKLIVPVVIEIVAEGTVLGTSNQFIVCSDTSMQAKLKVCKNM